MGSGEETWDCGEELSAMKEAEPIWAMSSAMMSDPAVDSRSSPPISSIFLLVPRRRGKKLI